MSSARGRRGRGVPGLDSRPQLAIVELMISGGLGAELCQRLKRHHDGAVLAISVLEARDEALAAGADAFLQKPFDPLELVSTVKDLLGIQRAGRSPRAGKSLVDERLQVRRRGTRPGPRRRSANERDQPDHRSAGVGEDHPRSAGLSAGATEERPAIYLSIVSELFEKILRYVQIASFLDRDAIGRSVYYEDLGGVVGGDGGLAAVAERIGVLIKERRPGSSRSTASRPWPRSRMTRAFRRFLHDLAALLTAFPATCFWIGNTARGHRTAPEFAVADGIISLATQRMNERTLRHDKVTKLRAATSAQDVTHIAKDGITVFPGSPIPSKRMTTGSAKSGSHPASRRSTRCSRRATRRVAPPW